MLTLGVSVLKTLVCVIALSGLASLAVAQGPVEGNRPVFPGNNIWNARVDQLPVNSSSSAWVHHWRIVAATPDFGSGTYKPIGIPYVTVPGSQTKYPATFTCQSESDPGPYAVPLTAPIEGGSSTGDRHAKTRLGTSSKASDQSARVSPEIVVSVWPLVRFFR